MMSPATAPHKDSHQQWVQQTVPVFEENEMKHQFPIGKGNDEEQYTQQCFLTMEAMQPSVELCGIDQMSGCVLVRHSVIHP